MSSTKQKMGLPAKSLLTKEENAFRVAIFLATSGHSGVDRVMTNLIDEFVRRGIKVDLLRIRNHGPYINGAHPNLTRVELGCSHVNTSLLPLVKYLRQTHPHALLCDKDRVNRTALWAKQLARSPTRVVIRIGTTITKNLERRSPWARWCQYASIRRFYRWASAIILPSLGAAQDLSRIMGIPVSRIRVVPNPILTPALSDLSREGARHTWFLPGNPPVILGVGELCARKDFATLIKAFAELRKVRTCRLMLLGEGRQRGLLEALVREKGLESEVAMPGFVANPYAYMSRARLLVLSSSCEGFGNVLAEALALGLPVVSTDCPSGPREILQNGKLGMLVPVGDVDGLAKAMRTTLDKPLAGEILKSAAEAYSVERCAGQYLRIMGLEPLKDI